MSINRLYNFIPAQTTGNIIAAGLAARDMKKTSAEFDNSL